MTLIFEKSQAQQRAYSLPQSEEEFDCFVPESRLCRKSPLPLPEVSELDLTRHFSGLAKKNMGVDTAFYPLGSCTMKFNPRINEWAVSLVPFARSHPMAPEETVQGSLQVIYELLDMLCDLCGMKAGSLAPAAGAQGEFCSLRMIAAYHRSRGDEVRREVLIPDNAHGTNPASATLAGFKAVTVATDSSGDVDLDHLRRVVSERTAALMLTNPNTLGLFSPKILDIAKIVHERGGLLFYDGANLNAILHVVKPGEMGFDVMHLNLHKTFSTPHGGGGPGAGPVLCGERLAEFLPVPQVQRRGDHYVVVSESPRSIGRITSFYGHFAVALRAYLYCKLNGKHGLRRVAEQAVLNANYLKEKLSSLFRIPYPQPCMHEFVVQADNYLEKGIRALDIAKRLLDYGIHAPTVYFPLIVKECLLIEPTETESKATLDFFLEVMRRIVDEIHTDPDKVRNAPHTLPVRRLDEARAARQPVLRYTEREGHFETRSDNV